MGKYKILWNNGIYNIKIKLQAIENNRYLLLRGVAVDTKALFLSTSVQREFKWGI